MFFIFQDSDDKKLKRKGLSALPENGAEIKPLESSAKHVRQIDYDIGSWHKPNTSHCSGPLEIKATSNVKRIIHSSEK